MFFASRDDDATHRGDGNEALEMQLEKLRAAIDAKNMEAIHSALDAIGDLGNREAVHLDTESRDVIKTAAQKLIDCRLCEFTFDNGDSGSNEERMAALRRVLESVARVGQDDPHFLQDQIRRIDECYDQGTFKYIQGIIACFGGLYGDRSPLTLEELQNHEWPIKDIVGKFRKAGMRDGVRRTLEEAREIYEKIPEDVRRTPEAITDYLWGSKKKDFSHIVADSKGGSISADNMFWEWLRPNRARGNATVSEEDLRNAAYEDWFASEKAKIKTAGKAAAIAAGLATLVTAAPRLIREVQSGKPAKEIKKEVKRLLGKAVWNATCQAGEAGLHAYLRLSLGPFAGSIVGTFAVESITATWAYVHGDMSARGCIDKITSSVGIACVTIAFPPVTMGQMIRASIILISGNLSDALRERIPIIVDSVCEYVTCRLGVASTIAGAGLVLCSQTGNAVYIIGVLGAEASTTTAISSLRGAAKTNAALAWLGRGTKANGYGGKALGQYILTNATYTGYGLALIGSGILAQKAWKYATRPKNVSFCAEFTLSGTCVVLGPDEEPVFTRALSSTPPPRFIYIMGGAIMGCLMTIIVLALTMGLQEAAVSAIGLLEKVPVPFQNASRPVLGFYTSEEFHIPAPLVCPPGSQLHGLEPTF